MHNLNGGATTLLNGRKVGSDKLYLDDSKILDPHRVNLGKMQAYGGIHVPAEKDHDFRVAINNHCLAYHIPKEEPFKWSPNKRQWFRHNIQGIKRTQFFVELFEIAALHSVRCVVVVEDMSYAPANAQSLSHDMDCLTLAIERYSNKLEEIGRPGDVHIAEPGGGNREAQELRKYCISIKDDTRGFTKPMYISHIYHPLPFCSDRCLQVADVVVSASLRMVCGGLENLCVPVFNKLIPLFYSNASGLISGYGFKIHPSKFSYLYRDIGLVDSMRHAS